MKVQAEGFHLNGHIIGFRPQTQELELPHKTLSNTLAVKGLSNLRHPTHIVFTEWTIQILTSRLYEVWLCRVSLFCKQFYERLKIIFMPIKHQPDLMYLRQVPLKRIHIFTFIQLFCLAVLWAIKSTPAALIFPVMVSSLFLYYITVKPL